MIAHSLLAGTYLQMYIHFLHFQTGKVNTYDYKWRLSKRIEKSSKIIYTTIWFHKEITYPMKNDLIMEIFWVLAIMNLLFAKVKKKMISAKINFCPELYKNTPSPPPLGSLKWRQRWKSLGLPREDFIKNSTSLTDKTKMADHPHNAEVEELRLGSLLLFLV